MGDRKLTGLIDERIIAFYPSLAQRTGVNKALVIQQIHFMCKGKAQDHDQFTYRDSIHWVFNTIPAWIEKWFPWMAESTLKRIFQELEAVDILITRESEFDGRSKWLAINYDRWDSWMSETPEDDKERIKKIPKKGSKKALSNADRDQKDPEKGDQKKPDHPPNRDQKDPDVPPYIDTKESSKDSLLSKDSSSKSDDAEFMKLVESEVNKLYLDSDGKKRLMNEGLIYALAMVWHVIKHAKTNRAGLAITVMNSGGPPDELLERASYAVEHKTLNGYELERLINRGQLAVLCEDANERAMAIMDAAQHEPATTELIETEPTPSPIVVEELPMCGPVHVLDIKPGVCEISWRQIWHKALGRVVPKISHRLKNAELFPDGETLTLKYLYRESIAPYEDEFKTQLCAVAGFAVTVVFEYQHTMRPRPKIAGMG